MFHVIKNTTIMVLTTDLHYSTLHLFFFFLVTSENITQPKSQIIKIWLETFTFQFS